MRTGFLQAEEEAVLGEAGEAAEAGLLDGQEGIHLRGDVAADDQRALRRVDPVLALTGDPTQGNTMLAVDGDRPGDDPVAGVGDLEGLEGKPDDFRLGRIAGSTGRRLEEGSSKRSCQNSESKKLRMSEGVFKRAGEDGGAGPGVEALGAVCGGACGRR